MIKKAIILIILLIAGGAVFYVFQEGKKMAAVVGTEIISSARLDKNFRAALRYYEIADQTYRVENVDFASESFLRELRRSVLESLIINAVISEELGGIYGEELARRVKEKIDPIKNDEQTLQAASQLYGMDSETFMEEILRPQARRELLEEHLAAEKLDINPWLENRIKQAAVSVEESGFAWNGKEVEVK
ncbi:MAG: hypothetical protein AAB560_00485 [Patescibacteria group bacterium]